MFLNFCTGKLQVRCVATLNCGIQALRNFPDHSGAPHALASVYGYAHPHDLEVASDARGSSLPAYAIVARLKCSTAVSPKARLELVPSYSTDLELKALCQPQSAHNAAAVTLVEAHPFRGMG